MEDAASAKRSPLALVQREDHPAVGQPRDVVDERATLEGGTALQVEGHRRFASVRPDDQRATTAAAGKDPAEELRTDPAPLLSDPYGHRP